MKVVKEKKKTTTTTHFFGRVMVNMGSRMDHTGNKSG